ncbi:MAG: hypothetical protein ACLFNC_01855 [Halodesulfurarchaeum sp.]
MILSCRRHSALAPGSIIVVDLTRTLGTDDVDVVDLDAVDPEVGAAALEDGIDLLGDPDEAKRRQAAFDVRTTPRTHEERRQRFDELLARMEGKP